MIRGRPIAAACPSTSALIRSIRSTLSGRGLWRAYSRSVERERSRSAWASAERMPPKPSASAPIPNHAPGVHARAPSLGAAKGRAYTTPTPQRRQHAVFLRVHPRGLGLVVVVKAQAVQHRMDDVQQQFLARAVAPLLPATLGLIEADQHIGVQRPSGPSRRSKVSTSVVPGTPEYRSCASAIRTSSTTLTRTSPGALSSSRAFDARARIHDWSEADSRPVWSISSTFIAQGF